MVKMDVEQLMRSARNRKMLGGPGLTSIAKESRKKNRSFFSGLATKRGGGVMAWPLRKKTFFEALKKFWNFFFWPLSSRWGG